MPFDSLKNIPKQQVEFATAPKFSTLQYRYETFVEKIENGTMNNDQLKMDIINNYKDYCNYDNFHDPSHRKAFQTLWTNKRFLNAFLNALNVIQNDIIGNSYYRTSICKIAFDYYYKIGKNNPEDEVSKLLLKVANTLNKREILVLSAFMHEVSASFIMMASYSSFKQSTNIKRVNNFILKLGYDFSVKQIIDIYAQLYRDNFGALFNTTMTTKIDYNNLTQAQVSIYNKQNTALITILENMPSYEIKNVITGYKEFCSYNKVSNTRFDLYDLSEKDFPRTVKVLRE